MICANSSQLAFKHWTRILQRWPVDRVRPEKVSFQTVMKARLGKHNTGVSGNNAAESINANEAMVSAVEPSRWNENAEMVQANALYALLENRFAKDYPMDQTLRKPASDPEHYDNLVREMDEAPTRSWLGGLTKRIRGSLRLK